ncbi:hypothetical protein FVE85_0676 [Porphyridium purpureum]|uniref:Uncharacterized protein n=1 Tax=Porphyridium purpureum TaxID=35688 RepID=A0A5J4Z2Q5_PORPP|nr:hypothetical protein FVE85_0676 [Porphyridium purpureum]|eukprot:POR2658..scf208_2
MLALACSSPCVVGVRAKTPELHHSKDRAPGKSAPAAGYEPEEFYVMVDMQSGFIKDDEQGTKLGDAFLTIANQIYVNPDSFYVNPSLLVLKTTTRSDALRVLKVVVKMPGVARCRLEDREYYASDFHDSDSDSDDSLEEQQPSEEL